MPSDNVVKLCATQETIASELAKDPSVAVSKVVEELHKEWKHFSTKAEKKSETGNENERLERAVKCGKFPSRPSDLFLKVYSDVLDTLDENPLADLCAPSLIGSSGTIPLSIISVIPDIMRHYADLIANAQHEVFIATNYWEQSHSSDLVSNSLRELSKRCEGKDPVIVKLMYDRGTPSQVFKNHATVEPDGWEKVGLPHRDEIKNISLQVVNYHRPVLGTFHAKYMIVDRRVACLNSNNIQDRPNVEMMIHLEGPIVDSFYDMALFSWSNALKPPLPLLKNPPIQHSDYKFGHDNEHLKYIDTDFTSQASRALLGKQQEAIKQEAGVSGGSGGGSKKAGGPSDRESYGKDDLIGQHPAMKVPTAEESAKQRQDGDVRQEEAETVPQRSTPTDGQASEVRTQPQAASESPSEGGGQDDALQARDYAEQPEGQGITKQDEETIPAPEVLREEEKKNLSRIDLITAHLNAQKIDMKGTVVDDESLDDFRPHIFHAPHEPVPIAMVNRMPKGTPGHDGIKTVPQNVAWLSAFRNAQKSIFIQSPTFNASAVIPAALEACVRGIEVTLYLDLGFNDLGEMIPFQGGTNEQIIHNMYVQLNKEGKQENLKVFWYTAKDQEEPMSAAKKARNCHVKFMAVDDQIAILGNGNQDTQSWFHSQEINVLVDSPQLVHEWITGINANQNTRKHGLVSNEDGIWRAPDGRIVESSGTKTTGFLGGLKGISGAIKRVRGTGGF